MIKKSGYKKGATLIELSVVLAVLSIITVMAVSFSIFFSERTKTSVKANDLMQEVASIKKVVENWTNDLSYNDAIFSLENSSTMVGEVNGAKYYLSLSDNRLSANLLNGESLSYSLIAFETLTFNIQENATQTLFICKAFYTANDTVQYISFTVNPFVGDVV